MPGAGGEARHLRADRQTGRQQPTEELAQQVDR